MFYFEGQAKAFPYPSSPPAVFFFVRHAPNPGGDGIENVSVVKSELMPGFSLKKTLGEPNEAAEKLLSTVIAPPGSGECTAAASSCLFVTLIRPIEFPTTAPVYLRKVLCHVCYFSRVDFFLLHATMLCLARRIRVPVARDFFYLCIFDIAVDYDPHDSRALDLSFVCFAHIIAPQLCIVT